MGRLRIIAGELKGRRIEVPELPGLRPTPDRVREALFSILGERVVGACVLDAFCGSGALGIEALSRGARTVTFGDVAAGPLAALRRNLSDLDLLSRSTIVSGDVIDLLRRGAVAGPFDLVLADPPYAGDERPRFQAEVARVLDPDGLFVVEREARGEPGGARGLESIRTAVYGRTALDLFAPPGQAD